MTTGAADKWNRGVFSALKKLVHLIATVHFWYGIYFEFMYVFPPKGHVAYSHVVGFGGKFRYLTVIGAVNTFDSNFFSIS